VDLARDIHTATDFAPVALRHGGAAINRWPLPAGIAKSCRLASKGERAEAKDGDLWSSDIRSADPVARNVDDLGKV
jgi:hypothetical protein